jgi:hypothetical protein
MNGKDKEALTKLVSEKADEESRGAWCEIAEILPNRSV